MTIEPRRLQVLADHPVLATRGELVQLGLVRQVGTATKPNGRKAVVWGIA